jgi:hypothetical protein
MECLHPESVDEKNRVMEKNVKPDMVFMRTFSSPSGSGYDVIGGWVQ